MKKQSVVRILNFLVEQNSFPSPVSQPRAASPPGQAPVPATTLPLTLGKQTNSNLFSSEGERAFAKQSRTKEQLPRRARSGQRVGAWERLGGFQGLSVSSFVWDLEIEVCACR